MDIPTLKTVINDLDKWEEAHRKLSELIVLAREHKQREEREKKSLAAWTYTSRVKGKREICSNEACAGAEIGYHTSSIDNLILCSTCFCDRKQHVNRAKRERKQTKEQVLVRSCDETEWYYRDDLVELGMYNAIRCCYSHTTICPVKEYHYEYGTYRNFYYLKGTDRKVVICLDCWTKEGIHTRAVADNVHDYTITYLKP